MNLRKPVYAVSTALVMFGGATLVSLSAPVKVAEVPGAEARPLVLDRMGHPIAHSFDRAWNLNHRLKLEEVPALMIKGLAHAHGLTGHGLATRVAREVHGRGSSPWQRWLSTCDGVRLSQQNTRDELMEFFINQVPIAKSQRGVLAGARTFFGVEPYALSATQTIALVAMTLDPERLAADSAALQRAKEALAQALLTNGHFDQRTFAEIQSAPVSLAAFDLGGSAPEFFSFVISRPEALTLGPVLKTTLDPRLQKHAQQTLDERTRGCAAVIIADHEADQILAWAVARDRSSNSASLNELLALRAAGTMLNPFVYALALERGFTALSLLESPTGNGGFVTLREALQSPASGGEAKLRAEIGDEDVMWRLRDVGLRDASTAENARTSLWELAQAYAALARSGRWRPLNPFTQPTGYAERPAFREDAASLVNNMLAPDGHIAIHSTQAAEGAWTVLYGFKHLVAIWLEKPQDPQQPARLARALAVSALNGQTPKPLHISSRLKARQVCREGTKIKASDGRCPAWTEYLPVSRVH